MQYILEDYTLSIYCDWVRDKPNPKHVFLHENFLHMLTFGVTNCKQTNEYIKNQPNGKKKNHFPCYPFKMDHVIFKILMSYII
jgi:hypothetical protein